MYKQTIQRALCELAWNVQALGGLLILLVLANTASAITLDDYLFEGSYGTGDHRAALVVDFPAGDYDAKSFAFEVLFDTDAINGFTLLDTVKNGTGSVFDYTTKDYGSMGLLVNTLSYMDMYQIVSNSTDDPTLNYWVSNDASQSWTMPWVGLGDLDLNDNDTLGWTSEIITWYFVDNDDGGYWYSVPDFNDWHRPNVPLETPEPTAFVLIITGFLGMFLWGRWRRG